MSIAQAQERGKLHFAKIDTNGDGLLSSNEFETANGPIGRMGGMGRMGKMGRMGRMGKEMGQRGAGHHGPSADHKEALRSTMETMSDEEKAELRQQMRQARAEGRAKHAERRKVHEEQLAAELFSIIDDDGDGVVSDDEFRNGSTGENRALANKRLIFKRLDSDSSGFLTIEELPSPADRLRTADTDGDGLVTKDELRSSMTERRHKRPMRPMPSMRQGQSGPPA
jgi:Ca2+-binding EF-hand superfamily protein